MSLGGILGTIFGGGIFGNAINSADAAGQASKAQQAAAAEAAKISREQYAQTRADLGPYREAGTSAQSHYGDLIGLNGPEKQAAAMEAFRTDPGYQFQLAEGTRAIEGSAAARSGVLNGGTLKALQRFGQGTADQQYGSYLDRFLKQASLGENAAAQTGNFGAQAAQNQGAYALDAGAAKAGGYLGKAAAYSGALDNVLKLGGYAAGRA
jgi:hypothetical protein